MSRHPRVLRPPVPAGLQPWIASWALSMRAAGTSDRTIEMYVDVANLFAGWLDHREVTDWDQVGRDHLRLFFAWLRDSSDPCPHWLRPRPDGTSATPCLGYGKGYINNVGRALKVFWAWWADEEDAPNPMGALIVPAAPKPDENPPPVLTREQLATLIKDAETGRDFESRRDAAILRLFAATGCRLAELVNLRAADVDAHAREAVVTGKGNRTRTVRFDVKAARALDRYLRLRGKHKAAQLSALWLGVRRDTAMTPSGVYQALRRRGRRLGIDLHPHLLRHTFAHSWLDAGGAEGDLMELAGWTSPQMLRHYGRSARSARARRAYDRVDFLGGV